VGCLERVDRPIHRGNRRENVLAYASLITAVLLIAAPAAAKPTLLVAPLKRVKTDKADAEALTEMIGIQVGQSNRYTLVTPEETRVIDEELKRQLAGGCEESSCIEDIGGALGAQLILRGGLYKISSRYILTMKIIDIERQAAVSTGEIQTESIESILDLLPGEITRLLDKGLSPDRHVQILAPAIVRLRGTSGTTAKFRLHRDRNHAPAITGTVPGSIQIVTPGIYELLLEKRGYHRELQVIVAEPGTDKTVHVRLKPKVGAAKNPSRQSGTSPDHSIKEDPNAESKVDDSDLASIYSWNTYTTYWQWVMISLLGTALLFMFRQFRYPITHLKSLVSYNALTKYIPKYPKRWQTRRLISEATRKLNSEQYSEATRILLQALHQYPDSPRIHRLLGVSYTSLGKHEQARMHFAEFLKLAPTSAEATKIRL
jgi:TolB-like protein